jgi:hypothetical protein
MLSQYPSNVSLKILKFKKLLIADFHAVPAEEDVQSK